jgi:spermidine synthase
MFDGKKSLDIGGANYSYGSLQKVLKKALQALPFNEHHQNILVLGMGAGSIVDTIRNDFLSNAAITLVEIDQVIINIAEKEFGIRDFTNIQIIAQDAAQFVAETNLQYDLVVVDVFIGDRIPEKFSETEFVKQLAGIIEKKGQLIFNTIFDTFDEQALDQLLHSMEQEGFQTQLHREVDGSNNIVLGKKNQVS